MNQFQPELHIMLTNRELGSPLSPILIVGYSVGHEEGHKKTNGCFINGFAGKLR